MTNKQYRRWYSKLRGQYERRALRILQKYFRESLQAMPMPSERNFGMMYERWMNLDEFYKTYTRMYQLIGRDYGDKIAKGISRETLDLKMQNPFNQTALFNQEWFTFVENYLIANYGTRIVSVLKTQVDGLKKYTIKELEKGGGIDDIVEGMREAWGTKPMEGWMLRRVARTEVGAAANLASLHAANKSPFVMQKIWITAEDERVRDINIPPESRQASWSFDHRRMDGVIRDMSDFFGVPMANSGGELQEYILYPCDPSGSAGNVINCRCALGYRIKRGANGLPVRKDGANQPKPFEGQLTGRQAQDIRDLLGQAQEDEGREVPEILSSEEFFRLSAQLHRWNVDIEDGDSWQQALPGGHYLRAYDNLTPEEVFVLRYFTDGDYIDLNRFMDGRFEDIDWMKSYFDFEVTDTFVEEAKAYFRTYAYHLQNAINKLRDADEFGIYTSDLAESSIWQRDYVSQEENTWISEDNQVRLYRGLKLKEKYLDDLGDLLKAAESGNAWKSPLFQSSSGDYAVAQSFLDRNAPVNVLMVIDADYGAAVPIRAYSKHSTENEWLFEPNAQFEVVDTFNVQRQYDADVPDTFREIDPRTGELRKPFNLDKVDWIVKLRFLGYE